MCDDRRYLVHWLIGAAGMGLLSFFAILAVSMSPAADASVPAVIDLSTIAPGERRTVKRPGQLIFIVHRTPDEIASVREDDDAPMPFPQPDSERVKRAEWLVIDGVPPTEYRIFSRLLGQREGEPVGKYGGWFDDYSTAHYDLSGRVRKGRETDRNLLIPSYYFLNDTTIVIE